MKVVHFANFHSLFENFQFRQLLHHFHRLQPYGDDAEEEFQWILGVLHGFGGPEVGVVGDAAVFVGGDGLALHDPFEGGLAVDDVVVGGERDVFEGDEVVVNDGGFVVHILAAGEVFCLGEFHLGDPVASVCDRRRLRGYWGEHLFHCHAGMTGHGLVVQMPMGEIAAGLGEGAEIRKRLHGGDAREFLAEVVGVAAAVVRGMQQPVNGVEQVFMI